MLKWTLSLIFNKIMVQRRFVTFVITRSVKEYIIYRVIPVEPYAKSL